MNNLKEEKDNLKEEKDNLKEEKKEQQNCQICCETFTKQRRHSIKCNYCNNSVCLQCFRTYLLSDDSEQVCMCCKENVSTEFIYLHTPKKFQQDFLTKLTKLEIIREKALLVATEERMDLTARCDLLQSRIHYLNKHLHFFPKDDEIRCLYNDTEKEYNKIESFLKEKKNNDNVEKVINSFICPVVNCDGIVTGGKCSYCKNNICVKCHTLRPPEDSNVQSNGHKCDPNVLATMNLLKKDTKPCPKCKIPIHKIDGCDQMFCVKCKTAFSWKTGKIETGIVHNPHYFEWMRNRGEIALPRQPGDDPCDLEFDLAFEGLFLNRNNDLGKSKVTRSNKIYEKMISYNFIPRVIREVRTILIRLTENVHNAELINREKDNLRKKYIIQKKKLKQEDLENKTKIENNWFQQIKLIFKKREMKKDIIKLLEIFERCIKDSIILAFRTFDYKTMYETILSIVEYVQIQLEENEKRHGLRNKTSLSICSGISCKLIRW